MDWPSVADLTDEELLTRYRKLEPGDPDEEALFAEIERRNLDL